MDPPSPPYQGGNKKSICSNDLENRYYSQFSLANSIFRYLWVGERVANDDQRKQIFSNTERDHRWSSTLNFYAFTSSNDHLTSIEPNGFDKPSAQFS